MEERIEEGDPVKLIAIVGERRREYHIRAWKAGMYSTIAGPVAGRQIVGSTYGTRIDTVRGQVYLVKPTWIEVLQHHARRKTQVIYPKDSGYIALRAGIKHGYTVLEAGIGSGFLSAVLLAILCPDGRLIAYETRKEHAQAARRNIELTGHSNCLELRIGDVGGARDLPPLDAIILDLPDPWTVLGNLHPHLKPGRPAIVFVPTANQIIKLLQNLPSGWLIESIEEIIKREWEPNPEALRPSPRMIGHTGYIITLRRTTVTE
ncbi:MAG: tRNA (adenine-N1)-methyltransferase [Desulfurococcales archaeon]|nr:tRNA (adenine-N1)-methyltransferase [Desulfurococcales archaeon]